MRRERLQQESTAHQRNLWMLSLSALGIVYGDIGTSPLYAVRECFSEHFGVALNEANILGALSLIFWTITLVIGVKYMWLVMRADNKGEGGILSLMSLISGSIDPLAKKRNWFILLGLSGAALLYGDGIITPAISVLSAVEGLKIIAPQFDGFVVPLTTVIIVTLFLFQRYGTARIGAFFGPIILTWFVVIGALGLASIAESPRILAALNPFHAVHFFAEQGQIGLLVLGAVVLVVTGGEALYADMGHFGRRPIRLSWFCVAMPGLVLNYFGQGALLLSRPEAIANPFYYLAPEWGQLPLLALSTMAAIIASQALISGVFSVSRQAVQLGFLPRLPIIHTSAHEIGQIYIPFINWALMAGVVWLVLTFQSSANLASAYGVAVTGSMLITTILAYYVSRKLWGWNKLLAISVFGAFGIVDLAFFATNIVKVETGGWVPLAVGVFVYLLMSTWQKGRTILAKSLKTRSLPLEEFITQIKARPPQRVTGTAIYMSGDLWGVPVPLLHNLKHNKVLHSQIIILTIRTSDVPFVAKNERTHIETLAPNFYRVISVFGFMETPKIKHVLENLREAGIHTSIQETTFVLGRETILARGDIQLPQWREKIFAWMARNAERPTAFFKIPPNQVIEVGIQVEI